MNIPSPLAMNLQYVSILRHLPQAMKMVSAAKFKHDEKRMINGVPFAQPVCDFMDSEEDVFLSTYRKHERNSDTQKTSVDMRKFYQNIWVNKHTFPPEYLGK
jgi:F0F1-type ATP synthase gamma subunit